MPRPPRLTYAKALHHVALRCNNREFLFEEPWHSRFEQLLQEAGGKFPIPTRPHALARTGRVGGRRAVHQARARRQEQEVLPSEATWCDGRMSYNCKMCLARLTPLTPNS